MKSFFTELFSYNSFTNEKLFELLYAHERGLSEKTVKLANHIVNAHQIWNNRISKKETTFQVWEIHKFADLKRLSLDNQERSGEIILDFNLDTLVDYKTTKGVEYKNTVRDILFHVINHSNYHRAQIATELKQAGIDAPVTDYIFYKR